MEAMTSPDEELAKEAIAKWNQSIEDHIVFPKGSNPIPFLSAAIRQARREGFGKCETCEKPLMEDGGSCSNAHADIICAQAHKAGQLAMRERAARVCDVPGGFVNRIIAKTIRALEPEAELIQ